MRETYRDDPLGHAERRNEELEAALAAEQARADALARELDAARVVEARPPLRERLWAPLRRIGRVMGAPFRGFGGLDTEVKLALLIPAVIIGALIAGVAAIIYHHEVYDIRAGYVREVEHHPQHTTLQCTPVGKTVSCVPITHPERWSVTIARDGEDASWDISEADYDRLRGAGRVWFCTSRASPEECYRAHEPYEPTGAAR